jgi:tetratricopeptide (TPR) repeat protein
LADTIARVGSGDPADVVAAVSHAELLVDPRACLQATDTGWPTADATAAHDAYASAVRHLGELSTTAGATHYVASLAEGRRAATEAAEAAEAAGDLPLVAHAAWVRGRLALRDGDKAEAETAFREAAERAAETGQAPLRAAANVELVYVVGNDRERTDEARSLASEASALLHAIGSAPVWTARLAAHRASVLAHAHDRQAERAVALHAEATQGLRDVLGEDHPDVIIELSNLGSAFNYAGRPVEAEAALREALKRATKVWGERHPRTARIEGTLGLSRMRASDLEGARAHLRRSLDVRRAALGEDHAEVASARYNLAIVLRRQGDHAAALELLRRGLRSREADRGPDDPGHVTWLLDIGDSELALGHLDAARPALQRALDLLERSGGAPIRFAQLRLLLARGWAERDPAQARVLAQAARRGGADDPDFVAAVDRVLASLPPSASAH